MKVSNARTPNIPPWLGKLLVIFLAFFLVGGILSGLLFYRSVKDIVAHYKLPSPPEAEQPGSNVTPAPQLTPPKGPGTPPKKETTEIIVETPPPPKRGERINILLLGIDQREGETGPWRTDTMLLATLDSQTKTAGMISIPRDLWVEIPGYGENRVNTAHFFGGPTLAKKTVQYNLGIPVHYYVVLNFQGFERIIDALGGITIDVKSPIKDDKYPDENYGYKTIYFPAGVQHMDGKTALIYVRTRHGGSDFSRIRRQQQLLLAAHRQALSLKHRLIPKLPALLKAMGDTVQTDLQIPDILALAPLASQVRLEDTKMGTIDSSMTVPITTTNGANVLWPDREKIGRLVEEMFAPPTPIPEETATLEVWNGTPINGLAEDAATYLREQGYQVIGFGNAKDLNYQRTLIVDQTGKSYTANLVAQLFNLDPSYVRSDPELESEADICIILGRDFSLPGD